MILFLLLLLYGTFPALCQVSGPTVFLVSGRDTAAVRRDTVGTNFNGEPVVAIEPDQLVIEAVVGDTVTIEVHAEDWPDVTGWFITTESFGSGVWPEAEFAPASFMAFSGSPIVSSQEILPIGDNQHQFGQIGFEDAHGSGSGKLGAMVLPIEKSQAVNSFEIEKVTLVTVDTLSQSVTEVSYFLRFAVDVSSLPLEIPVTSDLNGNGTVDFTDFVTFARSFGTQPGDSGYSELLDFNGNGRIGFSDFVLFAADFGRPGTIFRQVLRG